MQFRPAILLFLLTPLGAVLGQPGEITKEELARAPGAARVAFLVDRAAREGWVPAAPALRQAAVSAYEANPGTAPAYQNLAIALAVVHDVLPAPHWPHGQVSAQALSRRLLDPVEAFTYWTKADKENRTLHKLKRLGASELKFVVDTTAPVAEMTWARQNVAQPLAEFEKVYDLVRYRKDRIQGNRFDWPNPSYQLPLILPEGGKNGKL